MSRCQRHLLVPIAPFGEKITIQNKCYKVNSLYEWIVIWNRNNLPGIETEITAIERDSLIEVYEPLRIRRR
jgi:hypothetical protein